MSRPRSLRERLQSTTFLAVLAGYGVLLVLNQGLQVLQRRSAHGQLVVAVRQELDSRPAGAALRWSAAPARW